MKVSIKVEGLKELDEALKDLPRATSKAVMRRVAKKALEPVIAAAKTYVPVGPARRVKGRFRLGGKLRASLAVSTKLSKRQAALMRREYKTEGKAAISMFAGPSALPHAHLIEFGTKPRYQKSTGKFVGQVAAQPFMRPAWDAKQNDVLAIFTKEMWTEIEKAAKRQAKKLAKAAKSSGG